MTTKRRSFVSEVIACHFMAASGLDGKISHGNQCLSKPLGELYQEVKITREASRGGTGPNSRVVNWDAQVKGGRVIKETY
jgi:hypothetical protein